VITLMSSMAGFLDPGVFDGDDVVVGQHEPSPM